MGALKEQKEEFFLLHFQVLQMHVHLRVTLRVNGLECENKSK